MKLLILRLKLKCDVMIGSVLKVVNLFSYHINTRWAWFFTNGMKQPKEIQPVLYPEDFH